MFSSRQLVRRYTPPTCTLEIYTDRSPLKGWHNQNNLKNFQFQLSFDDPRLPTERQVSIKGDRQQLEQFQEIVNNYIVSFLELSLVKNYSPHQALSTQEDSDLITKRDLPYLQSLDLVNHELFLGDFERQNPNQSIKLGSSQLFDLVTALEEYRTEIATAPELFNNYRKQNKTLLWGTVAATILTLGLTAIGIKVFYLSPKESNLASKSKEEPIIINPKINDVIPPKVPQNDRQVAVRPKLNEPLSSTEKLPPPPPVDVPKPPPDIPDPAKFPLPESNAFTIPQPVPPTVAIKPKLESKPPTSQPQTTIQPKVTKPSPQPESNNNSDRNKESESNLESNKTDNNSQLEAPNLSSVPSFSSPPEQTKIATNSEIANQSDRSKIPEIPQVKEIQEYFKTKWQAPSGLKQTLEYRLVLNSNGSIKRIVPLGKASQVYLDRTNIPLMGEKFVSPLAKQQDTTIRLLLSPDGKVKTFLE